MGFPMIMEAPGRAEALLAGERRLLEMVAWGCSLPAVLDSLCSLVDESSRGCHCSVLLVDPLHAKLQHGAAPSLPPSLNEAIHGRPVTPYWGPCAMAVHQKTQVIVSDVAADPRWEPPSEWGVLALSLGLRSCWTTPILSLAGKVLGTFAIYQREPGSPTPFQQDLIGRFTHIASIAIERAQSEAALRRSEAFLAEAERLSSTGSFSWRAATGEIVWSEQTYRIYGIDPALPVTFDLVGTRLHPEEIQWFQELVERGQREGTDLEFEHRLQMPDLSVKYLHVVAHANRDPEGRVEYIGAVQDVTERRLSEASLDRLRSELAHVSRGTALMPRPPEPVIQSTPVVFIVDDDVSVRESLAVLVSWAGWRPETFSSAQEFLDRSPAEAPGCLVLDVKLPDMNGLDLQARLAAGRRDLPVIFLTGHADVPATVQAMKAGAVEFLTKPFSNGVLLDAIRHALDLSRAALGEAAEIKALQERYASLTRREREVMALVVAGLLNKQIGAELGTSEITVKTHRGKVMRKMKADSLADLVRTAARLNLPPPAGVRTDTLV